MKIHTFATSICQLIAKTTSNLTLTFLAASGLSLSVLPQAVYAGDACPNLFMSPETRAHEQKYRDFIRSGEFEGRIGNTAAKAVILQRLRSVLPAGNHKVTVNHLNSTELYVAYAADGNVTITMVGRAAIQSDGSPLQRGFWLAPNVTFGVDGRVQLLQNGRIAVSTTIIRGDEKTPAGLERTDLSVEIDQTSPGTPTITLTEKRENWSVHRPEIQSQSTSYRIEPRN